MREWLKDLRKEKRMTMKDLSQKTGFAECTICLWEQGKRGMKTEAVLLIAEATGTKPTDLLQKEVEYLQTL